MIFNPESSEGVATGSPIQRPDRKATHTAHLRVRGSAAGLINAMSGWARMCELWFGQEIRASHTHSLRRMRSEVWRDADGTGSDCRCGASHMALFRERHSEATMASVWKGSFRTEGDRLHTLRISVRKSEVGNAVEVQGIVWFAIAGTGVEWNGNITPVRGRSFRICKVMKRSVSATRGLHRRVREIITRPNQPRSFLGVQSPAQAMPDTACAGMALSPAR